MIVEQEPRHVYIIMRMTQRKRLQEEFVDSEYRERGLVWWDVRGIVGLWAELGECECLGRAEELRAPHFSAIKLYY